MLLFLGIIISNTYCSDNEIQVPSCQVLPDNIRYFYYPLHVAKIEENPYLIKNQNETYQFDIYSIDSALLLNDYPIVEDNEHYTNLFDYKLLVFNLNNTDLNNTPGFDANAFKDTLKNLDTPHTIYYSSKSTGGFNGFGFNKFNSIAQEEISCIKRIASNNIAEKVNVLCENNFDFDMQDFEGKTYLMSLFSIKGKKLTALSNISELITGIIKKSKRLDFEDIEGNTSLDYALKIKNLDKSIKELITWKTLKHCIHNGKYKTADHIKNFIPKLKYIDIFTNKDLALIEAVKSNYIDIIKEFFAGPYLINIDNYDENGKTALIWSCQKEEADFCFERNVPVDPHIFAGVDRMDDKRKNDGDDYHNAITNLLIKQGADVNTQDSNGRTAFMYAAISDYPTKATGIITNANNLNLELPDKEEKNSLDYIFENSKIKNITLIEAIRSANINLLESFLKVSNEDRKEDVCAMILNHLTDNVTICSNINEQEQKNINFNLLKGLLDKYGAEKYINESHLMGAIKNKHLLGVKYFLEKGCLDINYQNEDGYTPLMLACQNIKPERYNCNTDILECLLTQNSIDVNKKNFDNKNALSILITENIIESNILKLSDFKYFILDMFIEKDIDLSDIDLLNLIVTLSITKKDKMVLEKFIENNKSITEIALEIANHSDLKNKEKIIEYLNSKLA